MNLIIPLEIPSQNETERGRTAQIRAMKTRRRRAFWKLACRSAMITAGLGQATAPRRLHIISYRKRLCRDIANIVGGAKACVDGLVDAGLLTDDNDKATFITYQQAKAKDGPSGTPCTVLDVCDIT